MLQNVKEKKIIMYCCVHVNLIRIVLAHFRLVVVIAGCLDTAECMLLCFTVCLSSGCWFKCCVMIYKEYAKDKIR